VQNLYVLGGRQKKRTLKREAEWHLYERALILQLDPETQRSEVCVDYDTPPEARADETSSVLFKSGTLLGNRLYACTSTEVLIYEVPGFRRVGYISLPCFNDLHHVSLTSEGNLLAVSTGLDMVVEFTPQGEVLRQWNVLGGDPWQRFSPSVDYRKVASTKPHQSHPNFAFQIGKEIWVTRFMQRDAYCLTHPDQRVVVGVEGAHDGHLYKDRIYFTNVDGTVVVVDQKTFRVLQTVDLKAIDNEQKALLGWCRGLMIVDDQRVWVGFTRVRKTKFKENVLWVKHVFREVEAPTHIALYDVEAKKCLQDINLEKHGMNIVFSIFPVPAF